MTVSYTQMQTIIVPEKTAFDNSLANAKAALAAVIAAGTVLYGDTVFAAAFPNDMPGFKTYLLNAQSAINTFITNFPAEPTLGS